MQLFSDVTEVAKDMQQEGNFSNFWKHKWY